MGHRHFPNLSNMSGFNQGHNNNHQSQQSYHPTEVLAVPENGSFISPLINLPRGGVPCDHQWNPEDRQHEYASQSFYREEHSLPPPLSGNSYYSYSGLEAGGNLYMHHHPDSNASQMNSSYYNRQSAHDVEGVIPYPLRGGEMGSYKRKRPMDSTFYGPFERGSTSRSSYSAGSSSSSQPQIEKPIIDYQGISSGPIGTHQHRGSGLSVFSEESSRNVRSRSRLDGDPIAMRTHFSSYPSQHYHSATFQTYPPGRVNLASSNADQARQEWNRIPISSAASFTPGRGSIAGHSRVSPMANQYVVGGSVSNVTGGHPDYIPNGHNLSSPHYFNGTSAQVARGSGNVHYRSSISAYRNGLHYPSSRNEAVSLDVSSYVPSASRYTGSLSAGGLHNNYRNVRSSLALERVQPIPGLMDTRHIIGTEVSMIVDHSPFYSASRGSFDQYGDMRLDVDNMSYEELLALEETIGNVSTGLSEDMILKCLSGKMYSFGDQNCVEGSCAICLEEYKSDDGIGTLKNCGHEYHVDCIKKWLMVKNVCPICKAAASTN